MIYVSSDFHFSHLNYVRGTSKWTDKTRCRNFDTIEQNNNTIINNINAVVDSGDTLYHLGDFAFGDKSKIPELRIRIKCENLILLRGNHDEHIPKYRDCFQALKEYEEFRYKGTLFCLFHYPILSWNEIGRGSIMLHGHTHGNLTYPFTGRIMDVGVDANDFKPLSIEDIYQKMMKIQPFSPDYH